MKQVKTISMILAAMFLMASCKNEKSESIAMKSVSDIAVKGTIEAELTAPPHVPAPVGNRSAKKLLVNMEILEKYRKLGANHFAISTILFNPFKFLSFYFNYISTLDK